MERIPTKIAEDIYAVLERYANASPKHYDREGFIYSFGVIANPPSRFNINCLDGKIRTFIKNGKDYSIEGYDEYKINAIIKNILSNMNTNTTPNIEDFKIREI